MCIVLKKNTLYNSNLLWFSSFSNHNYRIYSSNGRRFIFEIWVENHRCGHYTEKKTFLFFLHVFSATWRYWTAVCTCTGRSDKNLCRFHVVARMLFLLLFTRCVPLCPRSGRPTFHRCLRLMLSWTVSPLSWRKPHATLQKSSGTHPRRMPSSPVQSVLFGRRQCLGGSCYIWRLHFSYLKVRKTRHSWLVQFP